MSNKKITMMKLKRIIQMLSDGKSQNEICRETSSSKKTVLEYKKLADGTKLSYQELLQMEDSKLEELLQPPTPAPKVDPHKAELDELMPKIMHRLSQRYSNILLVYMDFYKKECPDGYGYTQFKKHVKDYCEARNYSYHNVYIAGEELQIDFAGDALYLTDKKTGELTKVTVLVCVMPYSELPFLMALPNATTEWFFQGLNKCMEYLGALPAIAKSDNMKQWVAKSDRYSPQLSDACMEWANHYGIGCTACRVRKPRDKGPVESAVNQLYKYVYARIQDEMFSTLEELNARLWELLDEYNALPYKGRTRWDIFNEDEKPEMAPLPQTMYRFRYRKTVKLGPTYHVCVGSERHFYSVPYTYVSQMVTVMWDTQYVEVYSGTTLICTHDRKFDICGYSTKPEHMPESHKAYERTRMMNAASIIDRSSFIGPSVKWVTESFLNKAQFPQQAYGKCQAVLSKVKTYGRERVENACYLMKTETSTTSLRVLDNILKNKRDLALQEDSGIAATAQNDNVRGASEYTKVTNPNDGKEGNV